MEIPKEVEFVINELKKNNFEAYLVGGCVRDLLRGVEPLDWDVATNAKPEKIEKIFPDSFTDNKFGTVAVLTKSKNPRLKEIEITPYRIESKYTDKRHPDKIQWAKTLEQDLKRRDFTINAMAAAPEAPKLKVKKEKHAPYRNEVSGSGLKVIDLFKGQEDLENKIIRAVGEPEHRFQEDALRLMRAVRFAAVLGEGWKVEAETEKAIKKNAGLLQMISKERLRDELIKIIMSERGAEGIEILRKFGLLKYIIPELEEGYGVSQNKHHIYEVYEHSLRSLRYACEKGFNKYVRLAALLHDIGKPRTKQGQGLDATFYNHEIVGAKMTVQLLNRLKFSKKDIEKIIKLVRYHLFYYNVDEVGESSVRRLVRQVGLENMDELLQVRMADRIGSGVPKAEPYKLRHLKYIIEKVSQDPISVTRLKVNGEDVMKILKIKPGPKIGQVLDILLGYVLIKPEKNKRDFLEKEIEKLSKVSESELKKIAEKARKERMEIVMKQDEMTKKKYWVT
ncbi:HD domain-containing protein [Candidatus Parcubacteria bacterium]|nr:HD domain-containing protein [Candidatus Parcubacteria bacterium]